MRSSYCTVARCCVVFVGKLSVVNNRCNDSCVSQITLAHFHPSTVDCP
jgi:hypothetical protein